MRLLVRAVLACGALASGVFAIVSACAPPDIIVLGTCGNSIVEVEAGEQCDDFPTDGGFLCFGADAGSRACHIACGDGGTCPSGFGCGVDGVCRNPSSPPKLVFASSMQTDVRELALADFDGDGRLDVVTRGIGATAVYFFDGSGHASGVGGPISLPRGRVTSGKLPNGAGASLVAFDTSVVQLPEGSITLTGTGLEAWLGQSDRTLTPILFSTIPLRTASDALVLGTTTTQSHGGDDDLLTYARSPSDLPDAGSIVALFTGGPIPLLPQYILTNPNLDSGVRGDIPTGRVPPHLECDTIAIGLARSKTATVLPTCDDAGAVFYGGAFTKPNVTFAGAIDDGPVLFADWDGDGLLDLVTGIATAGDGGPLEGIQVAIGNADGSFQPGVTKITQNVSTPLHAVGDIDRDGKLDWIDHAGVFLTGSQARLFTTLQTKQARILDVNRDGFLDAVALSSAGVDLWLGSGGALMNHRLYDLANATTFAIGDLDGDSNIDIIAAANQGGSDTLYVLWGTQGGFPSSPVAVGSVHEVHHLATGRITWLFGDAPDNVSSAIVVGLDENGQITIIPVQGHTNRQLTSPFTLATATDSGAPSASSLPLNGAIGLTPFDGGLLPSVTMLASIPTFDAGALTLTTWTAPATSSAQTFESASLLPPVLGGFSLVATSATAAQGLGMTTIDLDPSAKNGDELVAVIPSIAGGSTGSLAFAQLTTSGWKPLGSPETFDHTTRNFTASSASLPIRAMRADFDGDGNADLLLVYGTGTLDVVDAEIRFGDGVGHLVDAIVLHDVRSAAPINALGDGRLQLMSVGTKHIVLYALAKCGSGALHCFDAGTTLLDGDFAKTTDVICGDVTGDGVDDVIVAEPANFQVFVANAAIP